MTITWPSANHFTIAVIMNRQGVTQFSYIMHRGFSVFPWPVPSCNFFLPFCGPSEIDHYFCDVYPLLKLAYTCTHKVGFLVIANFGLMGLVIFMVLIASYFMIYIRWDCILQKAATKHFQLAILISLFWSCFLSLSSLFTLDLPQLYQKVKCLHSSTQLFASCSSFLSMHLETWR